MSDPLICPYPSSGAHVVEAIGAAVGAVVEARGVVVQLGVTSVSGLNRVS